MAIIIKKAYVCKYCGSPYIEYCSDVQLQGFTPSGQFITKDVYVNDDYCYVCDELVLTSEAVLIYIPAQLLLEIMLDKKKNLARVYLVPYELCDDGICFTDKQPTLLTKLGLDDFMQSVIQTIMDESVPEQNKLNILNTIVNLRELVNKVHEQDKVVV